MEIIKPNIYRILQKVNQIIYTLDTTCMPNIIIIAQRVLQIFSSQCPLWVKCLSQKREIIFSQIFTEFYEKVITSVFSYYILTTCILSYPIHLVKIFLYFLMRKVTNTISHLGKHHAIQLEILLSLFLTSAICVMIN